MLQHGTKCFDRVQNVLISTEWYVAHYHFITVYGFIVSNLLTLFKCA